MVLLVEKLSRSLKLPSMLDDRRLKPDGLSSSLSKFRSKISEFIAGIPPPGSELAGFNSCFDLIHAANRAFAEMAVEIDHPMRQWGPNLTDDYFTSTSDFLALLNAVASSVSRLTHAKMSLRHAASTSPPSAASKIAAAPHHDLKLDRAIRMGVKDEGSPQEHALLRALALCKTIVSLALGFMVSGLQGDIEAYLEVRRNLGEFDDSLLKDVDSRLYRELIESKGGMKEVREVNAAIEQVSAVGVDDLKRRLKDLENSLEAVEKQANHLFSQVLSARNKLLANIRFPE